MSGFQLGEIFMIKIFVVLSSSYSSWVLLLCWFLCVFFSVEFAAIIVSAAVGIAIHGVEGSPSPKDQMRYTCLSICLLEIYYILGIRVCLESSANAEESQ